MDTAPKPLPPLSQGGKQLIVFDFDWSLVDQDTDRWVHEVLCPPLRAELQRRKTSEQFTDLCADLLVKLHAQTGASKSDILEALKLLPFHPGVKRGVKELKEASQTKFFLLSNSNTVYISTILRHHGLLPPSTDGDESVLPQESSAGAGGGLFDEIVTNPASFQPNGLLKLERRIPATSATQHTCKVGCSANMCKGDELTSFLNRHGGKQTFERIIYVGDGGNDFCPILRLEANDLAFVRKFRGLQSRIAQEGGVKAGIRYWNGGWELEGLLGELRGAKALDY